MISNRDDLIWDNPNLPNKTTETEDVLLVVREDLALLILRAIGLYLVFFVLLIFRFLLSGLNDFLWISLFDSVMYTVALVLTVFFLIIFHNYYLSLQVITTERIIDIDQVSLFSRETSSTTYDRIEDVTYKKRSFLNLLLNYGQVIVQTAGNAGREDPEGVNGFVFNNIPHPEEIAQVINVALENSTSSKFDEAAKAQAKYLQKVIGKKSLV